MLFQRENQLESQMFKISRQNYHCVDCHIRPKSGHVHLPRAIITEFVLYACDIHCLTYTGTIDCLCQLGNK